MATTKQMQKSKQALAKDYRKLLEDTEQLLKALPGELDNETSAAKARLEETMEEIKDKFLEVEEKVEEKVKEEVQHADELVREYPYHTAGIALGFGMLMGLLLGRKS